MTARHNPPRPALRYKAAAGRLELADADSGRFAAVFSTFDVVDADGDVTLPGAFTDGANVPVSTWMHGSWGPVPPVGTAEIRTTAREAIADGRFFVDTAIGADLFTVVRHLAAAGLGQWSYGYDVVDSEPGEKDGRRVRILRRLTVREVSPVLLGAGVDVRTLATGGDALPAELRHHLALAKAGVLARHVADARQRHQLRNIRDRARSAA